MSPEQVLAQADLIIVASIGGVDSRWSESGNGMAFTDYSLLIDQVLFDRDGLLRHQTEGGIFRLSFGGGVIDGREILISGVPAYVQGEQVILFIDSKEIGTISPLVGMSAGDYRVSVSPETSGAVSQATVASLRAASWEKTGRHCAIYEPRAPHRKERTYRRQNKEEMHHCHPWLWPRVCWVQQYSGSLSAYRPLVQ